MKDDLISEEWFQIVEIEDEVYMIEEPGHVQSFLINGDHTSALIDTGMGFKNINAFIKPYLREKTIVLNTHWHFDHIGGNSFFQNIGISKVDSQLAAIDLPNSILQRIYLSECLSENVPFPLDFNIYSYQIHGFVPSFFLEEGDFIDLGNRSLEVINTPGHTHGSVSFFDERTNCLFCGDLLYSGTLYLHFDDSDLDEYIVSLTKLMYRQNDIKQIFCAHNVHYISTSMIDYVLAALQYIKNNEEKGMIAEFWGHDVLHYQFEGFSVLAKLPHSKGICMCDFK